MDHLKTASYFEQNRNFEHNCWTVSNW